VCLSWVSFGLPFPRFLSHDRRVSVLKVAELRGVKQKSEYRQAIAQILALR
jgi:hypothetical protein